MAKQDKPNILVIWGDDIGISNLRLRADSEAEQFHDRRCDQVDA